MKKSLLLCLFSTLVASLCFAYSIRDKEESFLDSNIKALLEVESQSDCDTYCAKKVGYTCIIKWPGDVIGITCLGYGLRNDSGGDIEE